jgi:hypothetical protein
VLFDRQIHKIDSLKRKIDDASGWHTNRASIIRAALDAVFACCTPPCRVTSEADLRKQLAKRLTPVRR